MRSRDEMQAAPPDGVLAEVAALLAAGVLRLRRKLADAGEKTDPEFRPQGLEVSEKTVLSVHEG